MVICDSTTRSRTIAILRQPITSILPTKYQPLRYPLIPACATWTRKCPMETTKIVVLHLLVRLETIKVVAVSALWDRLPLGGSFFKVEACYWEFLMADKIIQNAIGPSSVESVGNPSLQVCRCNLALIFESSVFSRVGRLFPAQLRSFNLVIVKVD